jgi:hypothetical protein
MKIKDFKGKYETIIETTITRYQQGGILSGDLVRFRKDAMKNDKVKDMMENYKAMIQDAIGTDLNLRVSAVKSIRPTTAGDVSGGANSGTRAPTDYWVDLAVEYAPGLWRDPITVPIEVLEIVDTDGNLAPVPDSVKRKNKVEMPKEVDSPDGDRKNPNTNTKPQFPNKTTDGRSQVKKPKEVKKKNQGKLTNESLELTLEDVFSNMVGADAGADMGAAPGVDAGIGGIDPSALGSYKLTFGEPYGRNPDELISKIQGMEGLSNNMDAKFEDDNNLTIKVSGDVDPDSLKNMISNIVKGSVEVTKDETMTEFEPKKSVTIASGSPSIGA